MCLCRTKAHFSEAKDTRILTLDPVEIEFYDLTVKLQTIFYFEEGSSQIKIQRRILEMSRPDAEIEIQEYFTGCYGTTEYPEDMSDIVLKVSGNDGEKHLDYAYKCREEWMEHAKCAEVVIPNINTKASVGAEEDVTAYIREGYAFSPMYTLGLRKKMKDGEVLNSWLRVERAD